MSKLPELILTKAGAAMLAKTPIGSEIPVTKWRIGDGQLPGDEDPRDRTQLVNPVRELPISSVKNDGNQCLIKGQLVNTEMAAFTWRETGLYATDPDDGEILYAYGYEADGAEIPAGATQLREIEFGVELVFDNAANVTAVISKTLVFATLDDLEQTKADAVEEALEQITTSPVAEDLTDSDAFATVTASGIKRTPLSLLKQVFGKLFAPSGFGLGTSPKVVSNFDTATLPGWYSTDNNTTNGPQASSYGDIGALLVLKHDYRLVQVFCCYAPGGISQMLWFIRGYDGAKFDAWKCVNPELVPGREYKTADLLNNKPVYEKIISFGRLPNATTSRVAHKIADIETIVAVSGSTSDKKNIPTLNYGGGSSMDDVIDVLVDPTNVTIYAARDRSNATANVLIRYTKTADE